MSRFFSVWLSFGMLAPLILAVGAFECTEKETGLKPMSSKVTQLTECLLECTGMTYIKKLQLQDNHNIRLTDSAEGDLGEHCWPTELMCITGESFRDAYVVLPVDVSSVRHEMLEVKTTGPAAAVTLQAHSSPSTIAESCGLRYEVTQHFRAEEAGTSFCVQVVTQEDALGDKVLKCPPYLVTFWQRKPNQPNQEGDA